MSEGAPELRQLIHDIRGPLSVLISYASLLADGSAGPLTAEQRQMADDMLTSAKEIAVLVDRVGAFARGKPDQAP